MFCAPLFCGLAGPIGKISKIQQPIFLELNRYRRKYPKVDASIFDSSLSHTPRSDTSEKKTKILSSNFGRFRMWTSFESSPVSVGKSQKIFWAIWQELTYHEQSRSSQFRDFRHFEILNKIFQKSGSLFLKWKKTRTYPDVCLAWGAFTLPWFLSSAILHRIDPRRLWWGSLFKKSCDENNVERYERIRQKTDDHHFSITNGWNEWCIFIFYSSRNHKYCLRIWYPTAFSCNNFGRVNHIISAPHFRYSPQGLFCDFMKRVGYRVTYFSWYFTIF